MYRKSETKGSSLDTITDIHWRERKFCIIIPCAENIYFRHVWMGGNYLIAGVSQDGDYSILVYI